MDGGFASTFSFTRANPSKSKWGKTSNCNYTWACIYSQLEKVSSQPTKEKNELLIILVGSFKLWNKYLKKKKSIFEGENFELKMNYFSHLLNFLRWVKK